MTARNVLGTELESCCTHPMTGWFRDGDCRTEARDRGRHVVCARMTTEFLVFSRLHGNDLTTAVPEADFPGLKPGDRWCLCVDRWREAADAGLAPPVVLEATEESALDVVDLDLLKRYAWQH